MQEEFLKETIKMAQERDELLKKVLPLCPPNTVVEHTLDIRYLHDDEYFAACENYCGEVYFMSSTHSGYDIWIAEENQLEAVKQFLQDFWEYQIYITLADFGTIDIYAFPDAEVLEHLKQTDDYVNYVRNLQRVQKK